MLRAWILGAALALLGTNVRAADGDRVSVVIKQSRGVDAQVDYAALQAFGPWDDRNYLLKKEDLELLGDNEASITDPLPAFFRVELRKGNRKMPRNSDVPYPLSALNNYLIRYGGYQYEGKTYERISRVDGNRYVFTEGPMESEEESSSALLLNGEVRVSTPAGGAETAIAINPVNPNIMVAGSNGPNPTGDTTIRQKMWYSNDGGSTWVRSNPLSTTAGGNVCCDPTVSWSTDGTKAYTSALINCGSSCGIRFYRSDDFGVNWGDNDPGTSAPPPVDLAVGTADKQFIHVDTSNASPYKDRVYVCYHESNVNKFQFSSDFGVTFSTKITVDGVGRGVGCDLTSDRAGNLYYFYPGLDSGGTGTTRQIRMAKSTDGGVTFATGLNAGNTNDSFNYGLPSMETRKVAKIVQADADLTTGPNSNSIYVIWPDITGPEDTTTVANNHSQIKVGYSRDGGATWNVSIPHETADVLTVDRYQPSIKVDDLGRVHVIYYDTRHSVNRNGVDMYYNISYDGAVTWGTPRRITTVTSANIADSFEFGDYSHMDGVLDQIITIFTDNRAEVSGGTVDKDAYAAQGFADPFSPTYVQTTTASVQKVCAGNPIAPVTLTVRGVQGYVTPVDLSTPTLPAAITGGAFSVNPVTPTAGGASSIYTATVAPGTAAGPLGFTLRATSQGASPIVRDAAVQLTVQNPLSAPVALAAPADSATGVSTLAVLSWTALPGADQYTVQIATNPAFTGATENTVTGTSFSATLQPDTLYYWRVKAANSCGENAYSSARSFRTALEICVAPGTAIPDNNTTGITSTVTGIAGTITDLNVKLRINHTWVGDVSATLRRDPPGGPAGTPIALMARPGNPASTNGCSSDNIDAIIDDEGTAPIENACSATAPAIAGVLTPNEALTGFDGQDFNASWVLTITDTVATDSGTLVEWCLIPTITVSNPDLLLRDGFE